MTKWADYLISAVSYDNERQIISLKRHHDTGEKIDSGEIVDKATVASDIDNGRSYMTIYSSLSNWKLGEKIRSSRVDNHYSLRIDDNKVKHDNLGSLPELSSAIQESPTISKKITDQIESQISQEDKALLKNMGAKQHTSIESIPTKSDSASSPKITESIKDKKSKEQTLAEYEKDYLKRLDYRSLEEDPKIKSSSSPHGTLPKGFDESTTTEPEPQPEPAKPEEIPESPHGTLPKQQEKSSTQNTEQTEISDQQSKELNELEKQIGDLKKAVDELDDSKNNSNDSPSASNVQAYCVKCKAKREIKNPIQSELKNGRPAIKGTCSICDTRVCRIGKLK